MLQCPTRIPVRPRHLKFWVAGAAMVLLQACSTAQIDSIPHAVGGLPEGAPQRLAQQPEFPAVHEMPPPRAALLDEDQQKRLHDDLIATRNRQPNQEKNIARDKKMAEEAAKKKNSGKPKKDRDAASGQPGGLFLRGPQ